MTKELKALEHIYYGSQGYGETDKYYKYLKEFLDAIDNANPNEALEELFKTTYFGSKEEYDKINVCYNSIKLALQRLEQIDNSNSSEALECLERIDNTLCLNNIKGKLEFGIDTEEHTDCDSVIGMTEELDTIKQSLLKAQEQEKVLEIIIDREVSIQSFRRKNYKDYEDYCNRSSIYENSTLLTKEEFELLKRWLYNEQIN